MARYLQFVARAVCIGAIIVIVAIVSRQVYLRSAAGADVAGTDEEAATMMIRYETMHDRLQTSGHALVVESLELGERSI